MDGCVLLTSTPECVVSPRRVIPRAQPEGSPRVNNTHPSMINPLSIASSLNNSAHGNLTIIGSDNGLLPGRRLAIIWTNVDRLLIRPLQQTSVKI